jgi:hypothetical protein
MLRKITFTPMPQLLEWNIRAQPHIFGYSLSWRFSIMLIVTSMGIFSRVPSYFESRISIDTCSKASVLSASCFRKRHCWKDASLKHSNTFLSTFGVQHVVKKILIGLAYKLGK